MSFCSPLWRMSFASALLAPNVRIATAVADKATRHVFPPLPREMRMVYSFGFDLGM
jgi:hypothetical protein